MEFPFKNFMKIGKVVESCGKRDLQNGGVSLFKQFYSLFQSKIVEVFHYGHVHVFFEKTHKVIFAEIALGSETGNRKRDRKSTRLNSSHYQQSRMPSSA